MGETQAETRKHFDADLQTLRVAVDSLVKSKPDHQALDVVKAENKTALDDAVVRINSQTRDIKRNLLDQERRIRLLLEEARKRLPEPIAAENT